MSTEPIGGASAPPLRVLHVLGGMNLGGAESVVMNVYRTVDRSRIQFDFLVHTAGRCHFDSEIEALGGRIFRLPHPRTSGLRSFRKGLRSVLREAGPYGAIHSHIHFFSGVVLQEAMRCGVPVRVAHSHTTGGGNDTPLLRRIYMAAMRKRILESATHLLGCSVQANLALYGREPALSGGRARLFPNAFRLEDFGPSRDQEADTTGDEGPLFGHIGRFVPEKRQMFLLGVLHKLLAKEPSARLLMVGDGPERQAVERKATFLGLEPRLILAGARSDVPAQLRRMDVFLFPSEVEGLGLAVVEAQAAGIPCIVSDAVPAEADLGIGLVQFLPNGAGEEEWAEAAWTASRIPPVYLPSWGMRKQALSANGYDVRAAARRLEVLYESGHDPGSGG